MLNLDELFQRQLPLWPACRERYEALKEAQTRRLLVDGKEYVLSYNPARAKSAKAKISADGRVGEERPCFLCQHALPQEQLQVEVQTVPLKHDYIVAVNPYPIVDHHFTLIAKEHTRQEFCSRIWDMAFFADLFPDYVIFFNGAASGASAPDHMHFQAVPKQAVPLLRWSEDQKRQMGVSRSFPTLQESDHKNILAWTDGVEAYWLVIDRKCHRPKQYFAGDEGSDLPAEEKVVISPAALEFCGLVPLCREEDFAKMTPALLRDLLDQCWLHEPMIHVGIMEGQQIRFSAEERTHSMNYVGEDQMKDVMDYGSNRAEAIAMNEYWSTTEPFTLEGVTIGKQFHWEQQEDQVFRGSLHIIACEGQLHAINLIPVEEYLKSVISSEMAASNSLELLKAHAIISRSWVLRQIKDGGSKGLDGSNDSAPSRNLDSSALRLLDPSTPRSLEPSNSRTLESSTPQLSQLPSTPLNSPTPHLLRIWDHDDHTLFDVCADDHCQRYQGIVRQTSPLVEQAIRETRGMVLTDAMGNICDARFSKCCGGRTEMFSTCWQDQDYDYLQPVDDPYCDPSFIAQLPGGLEAVMNEVLNGYDQQTTDFHDWEATYTQAELSDLVERKLGLGLGTILALEPVERGASGRIKLLRLVGSLQSIEIGKELFIRKALSETHLYSSWFDVTFDPSTTTFHLRGKGWGHGVGLCQIGAAAMALNGFKAEEILAHYYPGARLVTKY